MVPGGFSLNLSQVDKGQGTGVCVSKTYTQLYSNAKAWKNNHKEFVTTHPQSLCLEILIQETCRRAEELVFLGPALWCSRLSHCLCSWHPILALVRVPAALLLIQLPGNVPWKAAEDVTSPWAPCHPRGRPR